MKKVICFILLLIFSCSVENTNFISIGLNNCDRVSIDGEFVEFDSFPVIINSMTRKLDSIQRSKFYVKLEFSNSAKMGLIRDIQNELIKANINEVKFYSIEDINCGF